MQPGLGRFAQGQHDVGVEVARIVAALGHRLMQREVRHHAAAGELLANERLDHGAALVAAQLVRQRDVDLPGQLGVGTVLHPLDCVPELLAIGQPRRPAFGHDDLAMRHAAAVAVVLDLAGALVFQLLAGPVGGSRDSVVGPLFRRPVQILAALAPPQDLGGKMIDRQGRTPHQHLSPAGDTIAAPGLIPVRRRTYVA